MREGGREIYLQVYGHCVTMSIQEARGWEGIAHMHGSHQSTDTTSTRQPHNIDKYVSSITSRPTKTHFHLKVSYHRHWREITQL